MRSTEFLARYRKLIKFLRVFSQIGYWAAAASVLILLPLGIYLSARGNAGLPYAISPHLTIGYLDGIISYNLALAAGALTPLQMTAITRQVIFFAVVNSAVFGSILAHLTGVLRTMEEGMPFDRSNARRISSIGIIFLVGSVLVGTAQASTANVIIHALGITDILSVNYSANTTMLSTGLLMLILAGVFRYGSYLQEEYDATL